MSLHSNESKREEYHRYLEKSGVIEYFTRVLVDLYELPEKPLDPNEYIRLQLSKFFPDDTQTLLKQIASHEIMIADRETALGEIKQQQFELRRSLEKHGINVDDLDFEEEDFNEARRLNKFRSEDDDGEGDGDGDGEENNFGFDSDNFVPTFKYHQTNAEDIELETGFETTKSTVGSAVRGELTINVKDKNDDDDDDDDDDKDIKAKSPTKK